MNLPTMTTDHEWLAARERLLERERGLARARDAVNAERRRLPMAAVTADYEFEGADGRVGLLDLFEGRRQLLAYHFWFEPGAEPCEGCSLWVSNLGDIRNLHARETSLALISRAPSAEIEAVRAQRGWQPPWYSVVGDAFNDDAGYAGEAQISVFVRNGGAIYRTYVTRGGAQLETLGNHWTLLELTPRGP